MTENLDAELIKACAEFRRLDDWLVAHPSGVEDEFNANHAARWETTYSLERIAPQTLAGLRAKAEVAVALSDEAYGERPMDDSCEFMVDALRDVVAFTQPEDEPEQDSELFAACLMVEAAHHTASVASSTWCDLAYATSPKADAEVEMRRCDAVLQAQVAALCAMRPKTHQGHAAMARLVLVIANDFQPPEDSDYEDDSMSYVPNPLLRTVIENLAEATP